MTRLSVNVNKVATLRNTRATGEPNVSMAAVRAFGVSAALEQARWKVSRAADALGVDRHVIKRLMTK